MSIMVGRCWAPSLALTASSSALSSMGRLAQLSCQSARPRPCMVRNTLFRSFRLIMPRLYASSVVMACSSSQRHQHLPACHAPTQALPYMGRRHGMCPGVTRQATGSKHGAGGAAMQACGTGGGGHHVNVDSLAVQEHGILAQSQGSHLDLGGEGVAVVHQAGEAVLPQVGLQLLQHALDAAPDGHRALWGLHPHSSFSSQLAKHLVMIVSMRKLFLRTLLYTCDGDDQAVGLEDYG